MKAVQHPKLYLFPFYPFVPPISPKSTSPGSIELTAGDWSWCCLNEIYLQILGIPPEFDAVSRTKCLKGSLASIRQHSNLITLAPY